MADNAVPDAVPTIRFDDPDPNTHDVVINVKGYKFYCVKMTLAKHSPHFYKLFFKDPKHIGRKEVTLKDSIDPEEFNTLLMLLHGVNKLNDEVVSGVLWMSKLWSCAVGLQQCLDFLEKSSNMSNKEKFDLAVDFELGDFKRKIIAECSSCDALHRIVPKDLMQLDHETMGLIFERNLALQGFPGRYEPRVRRDRPVIPPDNFRRPFRMMFQQRPPVFQFQNREARPESSSSSSSSSTSTSQFLSRISSNPSRKRAGEGESQEDPPRKVASGQLAKAELNQSDVVIIVEKRKFRCKKERLSSTSKYFEKMFNSGFSEKEQKEVKLEGIATAEGFKLFLDVIEGSGTLTDGTIEQVLSLADYLESPVLEDKCVEFLSKEPKYSKEKQFELGDKHNSMKLITRICSEIRDSYELHEVVPSNIDSLRSSTKTIVLQKSFELLGHRKPSAPPLPQQKEALFETLVKDFIDQAGIVDFQGTILAEQAFLLDQHVAIEYFMAKAHPRMKQMIPQDPRISTLMNQLQNGKNQIEKNAIQAQIHIIQHKNYHTAFEMWLNDPRERKMMEMTDGYVQILECFPYYISRDKKTENLALQNHVRGEQKIDVLYRNITREFEEKGLPEQELYHQPSWLQELTNLKDRSVDFFSRNNHNVQVPEGLRQIPREINFGLLGEFVANVRQYFYNIKLRTVVNQVRNQPAQPDPQPDGERQNGGDEQIQEGAEQDGQE